MMTRLIVFALLLTQFVCQAQTNISVIYSFVNGLGQTQTVKQVSFTPLAFGLDGKAYVVGDETFRVITSASYTNPMLSGFSYRVKYFSTIQPPTLTACFTNSFSTNVTGTVYAADYTAISTNLSNGLYAYSMAASDALFASLNQSTNIALVAAKNATNGLPSSVWTLGTASAQNTNVFLGTNFTVTTLNGLTNKFSVDSTGKGTLTIGNTNSTSNVVTNGAGLNYPAPGQSGSLAGNGGGVGGLAGFLLYPNSGAGAGYLAKYDTNYGVELYYPDPNGSTSTLLADQSHNLHVPAGLYDGNQSTGAQGDILTATGYGGVYWNNYMTAQQFYSDSATLWIASHDYGDGGYGRVSIGNIDNGGGPGNPNNGLMMASQAGNTTIAMDADTGYAQFGGGLSTINNILDDGSGNMTVNTSNNSGGLNVQGNVPNVCLSLYPTGTGGIKWQFFSTRSDSGYAGGEFIFNPYGYSPVVAYNANGGEAHGSFASSPVPSSGALFDKISVGTTVAAAKLEVGGTMHSTDNYTNDASLFVATKLGVGTTTPGATVDISGTVHSSGNYTNDASLFVATQLGVGTTTPGATVDISGTVHSTGNYTNDATIFAGTVTAATAITERAKDVAPHVTASPSTSGTVTASTSYWNETVYLVNFSTIASITIALPSSGTVAGQIYRIHTKSSVTTLSVTGGSFADAAVVTLTAGQTIAYQATTTTGTYIRIE